MYLCDTSKVMMSICVILAKIMICICVILARWWYVFVWYQQGNNVWYIYIILLQVYSHKLQLPEGVQVLHATAAAGHLSSSTIYPACLAPYLFSTACSDGSVRFWACRSAGKNYHWSEWKMPGLQSSLLKVPGKWISHFCFTFCRKMDVIDDWELDNVSQHSFVNFSLDKLANYKILMIYATETAEQLTEFAVWTIYWQSSGCWLFFSISSSIFICV